MYIYLSEADEWRRRGVNKAAEEVKLAEQTGLSMEPAPSGVLPPAATDPAHRRRQLQGQIQQAIGLPLLQEHDAGLKLQLTEANIQMSPPDPSPHLIVRIQFKQNRKRCLFWGGISEIAIVF